MKLVIEYRDLSKKVYYLKDCSFAFMGYHLQVFTNGYYKLVKDIPLEDINAVEIR